MKKKQQFISFFDDGYKIEPLHIVFTKMSAYIKVR